MIRRAYLRLAGAHQAHYRRAGAGEPLVLLHPSPLSSSWMEPVMDALRGVADTIAPDTPGYGASDPLPASTGDPGGYERPSDPNGGLATHRPTNPADEDAYKGPSGWYCDLAPYTEWLHEFIQTLGFRRVGLYGSATGAQIAVEFARAHPEATRFVVLDNVAHFTAEEREGMLARYFPDLSPRADGGHLQTAWAMVSGLWRWFPWYRQDEAHRVAPASGGASPETLRRMLVDHLRAGSGYARAYRAAMRNEDASKVRDIAVPVRIIRWEGGLLRRYADRLDDFTWPKHIRMVRCGPGMEDRLHAIRGAVEELNHA